MSGLRIMLCGMFIVFIGVDGCICCWDLFNGLNTYTSYDFVGVASTASVC